MILAFGLVSLVSVGLKIGLGMSSNLKQVGSVQLKYAELMY